MSLTTVSKIQFESYKFLGIEMNDDEAFKYMRENGLYTWNYVQLFSDLDAEYYVKRSKDEIKDILLVTPKSNEGKLRNLLFNCMKRKYLIDLTFEVLRIIERHRWQYEEEYEDLRELHFFLNEKNIETKARHAEVKMDGMLQILIKGEFDDEDIVKAYLIDEAYPTEDEYRFDESIFELSEEVAIRIKNIPSLRKKLYIDRYKFLQHLHAANQDNLLD